MGTFGPYNSPPSGNPDFTPGSVIASSEVDGNFALLLSQLNSQNIDDANVTPGGLTTASILDGTLLHADVSDADISGVDLTVGIGNAKLQNNAADARVIADNSVDDAAIIDVDGAKIQAGTIPLSALGFPIPGGPGNVPVGAVQWFAGAAAPPQWVICDGQELDQVTYAALFSVIGTVWNTGGEAPGNFRVPDLRSRSVVGTGTNNNLGDTDAIAEASRNSPEHSHTGSVNIAAVGDHQHGAGSYSGSKTGQSTGSAFDDPSRYEEGYILNESGAATLVSQVAGFGLTSTSPSSDGLGGSPGVKFTKLNHFHDMNITGIVISGSSSPGGGHGHPGSTVTIDNAEMPYAALLPIIYTAV